MKEYDRFSFPRNYSGKVPLFFRKFLEKFRRKFPNSQPYSRHCKLHAVTYTVTQGNKVQDRVRGIGLYTIPALRRRTVRVSDGKWYNNIAVCILRVLIRAIKKYCRNVSYRTDRASVGQMSIEQG